MDTLQKILTRSEELFLQYGIKSMTMDDISRHLGMSKKTLYQYFDNKNDLVMQVMLNHLKHEEEQIKAIHAEAGSAIEEMRLIFLHVCQHMGQMNSSILFDMQKYYPRSWDLFLKHKDEFIFGCILENMTRGRQEGYYRNDFDVNVIARIYISFVGVLSNPMNFPSQNLNMVYIYRQFLIYHLRGIASQKGLDYINEQKLTADEN